AAVPFNEGPHIQATIHQKMVSCLADSGATRSFCSLTYFQELREAGNPTDTNASSVRLANDTPVAVTGRVQVTLDVRGRSHTTWLSLLPGLSSPVVLGWADLGVLGIVLDAGTNSWRTERTIEGRETRRRDTSPPPRLAMLAAMTTYGCE